MNSVQDTLAGGFPHSEIHGSKSVRNSPWLIAAYDVLHRLSAPRHPPNALTTLDRSHCRYPPARQQTGSLEKTSFLRGRARSQAVKTAKSSRHAALSRAPFEQTFSSRCQITRASPAKAETARILVFNGREARHHECREWWSQTGSNRRPPACKAGALPTELWPRSRTFHHRPDKGMVGPGRLELPTSRLSGVRSNHLSYGPRFRSARVTRAEG